MHIALLGGRFDPPHNGHVQIARYVLQSSLAIDEVWFVPANTHPWRPIIASAKDRLAMTNLLKEKNLKVNDIDIARGGETYTIDTVHELQRDRHNTYEWILGSDQIQSFSQWKEYKQLQKLIHFLVIPREGYEQVQLPENFHLIAKEYTPTDLSSSEIRDRIRKGLSISGVVSEEVEQYIKRHKLYALLTTLY